MSTTPFPGEFYYPYPPSPELIAAARELNEAFPEYEVGELSNQGVFNFAWKSLEKFSRKDVNDHIKPQPEEIQAAILLGRSDLIETSDQIRAKYGRVYMTAMSGLTRILARGRRVTVPDESLAHFAGALPEVVNQVLPPNYPGFIKDTLLRESELVESDRFLTGAVTVDITRARMWHVINSVPAFRKYTRYMTDPAVIRARAGDSADQV